MPSMLKLLIFSAALAIVAYAVLTDADTSNVIKFSLVLLVAFCVVIVYAAAAKARRRLDTERQDKHERGSVE